MVFDARHTCLRFCAGLGTNAWPCICLFTSSLCLALNVFSFALCTRLGRLHPLVFGLIHCIYDQPLDPKGPTFFVVHMVGTKYIPQCHLGCLHFQCERCEVPCFVWKGSCPFATLLSIFLPMGWHHAINWWHLHLWVKTH
jgi:hypothetical protein